MTIAEASRYLGISTRTLRRAVRARRITVYRTSAGLRFKRSDLDDYMTRGRIEAEQPTLKKLLAEHANKVLAKRKAG
jgi:excisionase family DNA binding protein